MDADCDTNIINKSICNQSTFEEQQEDEETCLILGLSTIGFGLAATILSSVSAFLWSSKTLSTSKIYLIALSSCEAAFAFFTVVRAAVSIYPSDNVSAELVVTGFCDVFRRGGIIFTTLVVNERHTFATKFRDLVAKQFSLLAARVVTAMIFVLLVMVTVPEVLFRCFHNLQSAFPGIYLHTVKFVCQIIPLLITLWLLVLLIRAPSNRLVSALGGFCVNREKRARKSTIVTTAVFLVVHLPVQTYFFWETFETDNPFSFLGDICYMVEIILQFLKFMIYLTLLKEFNKLAQDCLAKWFGRSRIITPDICTDTDLQESTTEGGIVKKRNDHPTAKIQVKSDDNCKIDI